jgi:hypothetical protein
MIFLLLSAIGFAMVAYVFSDGNQVPLNVPLPAAGHSVAMPFHLGTAGRFKLEATVPVLDPDAVLPVNHAPMPIHLRLVVEQGGTPVAHVSIPIMHRTGAFVFGNVALYTAQPFVALPRGDLVARITGLEDSVLPEGGAMISLKRVPQHADPAGASLMAGLVRLLSWSFLVLGFMCMSWSARPIKRATRV